MRIVVSLLAALLWSHAMAQSYPAKPVRVIVPHQVGGGSDVLARSIGASLSTKLGQPFVVENSVAANGIVGLERCARSAPDGYTVCISNMGAISINPAIYSKLPYEPLKDFAPVANLGAQDIVLMVHPSVPASSMNELIALAKSKPGALSWASLGIGSHQHIAVEWFKSRGVDFLHVPYKSGPQAVTAAVAGEVQVVQIGSGQAVAMVKAGKLKPLAITAATRSSFLPEVPSYKELGLDLFVTTWNGAFVPAGTPREVVRLLNNEMNALLSDRPFRSMLEKAMIEPGGGTPEEFAAFLRADRQRFADIARTANIRMD
jgi:tripartite-type tricarboxylate transporter receptor subunit TctC